MYCRMPNVESLIRLRSGSKEKQRQTSDHPRAYQQHRRGGAAVSESTAAMSAENKDQRRQNKNTRFQRQPIEGCQARLLLEQAINSECEGQRQGDPGQRPVVERQIDDARRSNADGQPLHGPQPLPQQQRAKQDAEQAG